MHKKDIGYPVKSGLVIIFPWNCYASHIPQLRYSYDAQPSGNLFYSPHAATSNVAPATYGVPSAASISSTVTRLDWMIGHGQDFFVDVNYLRWMG